MVERRRQQLRGDTAVPQGVRDFGVDDPQHAVVQPIIGARDFAADQSLEALPERVVRDREVGAQDR